MVLFWRRSKAPLSPHSRFCGSVRCDFGANDSTRRIRLLSITRICIVLIKNDVVAWKMGRLTCRCRSPPVGPTKSMRKHPMAGSLFFNVYVIASTSTSSPTTSSTFPHWGSGYDNGRTKICCLIVLGTVNSNKSLRFVGAFFFFDLIRLRPYPWVRASASPL